MRILVAGFLTIDTIQIPVRQITSVGGPPAYAGLICSRFGHQVTPLTMVGGDFPDEQALWLARNGVPLTPSERSATKPTTRFTISSVDGERSLTLVSRCEDLSSSLIVPESRFNAALVSPIAGEVSVPLLEELTSRSDFTFLDPQGFVRRFGPDGRMSVSGLMDKRILSMVDALKMDRAEAEALTGRVDPKAALERIASFGVRKAIVTAGGEASYVLDGSKIYEVSVPTVRVVDSTGAGDILGGATVSWYVKTRDFLRSACFGIAASSLSLYMVALSKVDLPMTVDESANRLFSLASPVATI